MSDRIEREELVRLVAQRTGQGVTLKGFGGFFVRPERESWVFKFNPCQKWRALFGWTSTYKGEL